MQVILGVIFHFIGGFASGSFYIPYKKVKGWHWESYWIVGGLFSSILGTGFGWLIGYFAPEFVTLLAGPFEIKSPLQVATAMGAIAGLGIGAAAMAVGLLVSVVRTRNIQGR